MQGGATLASLITIVGATQDKKMNYFGEIIDDSTTEQRAFLLVFDINVELSNQS